MLLTVSNNNNRSKRLTSQHTRYNPNRAATDDRDKARDLQYRGLDNMLDAANQPVQSHIRATLQF